MEKERLELPGIISGIAIDLIGLGIKMYFPDEIIKSIGISLIVIGTALTFWVVYRISVRTSFIKKWHIEWSFEDVFPFRRLISLPKAAQVAYEELRHTTVGKIVEELNESNPLGFYVYALAEKSTLYGKHVPSSKTEIVLKQKMGRLNDNGENTLKVGGGVIYSDLKIEQRKLQEYIKEQKLNSKLKN